MPDWSRLGEYVVHRRVQLKLLTREALATRSGISTRVLGDIEKGRRDNYDPVTLAALEQALNWETGTVRRVLAGGEPTELDDAQPAGNADAVIRAIVEVLNSSISGSTKLRLIEGLIANDYRPARPARSEDTNPGEAATG